MAEETRKKAESVTITWEDGEEETLACGDQGDIFVVFASEEADHYKSTWSGGITLFKAVMASAIEFRARLYARHIHDEEGKRILEEKGGEILRGLLGEE